MGKRSRLGEARKTGDGKRQLDLQYTLVVGTPDFKVR